MSDSERDEYDDSNGNSHDDSDSEVSVKSSDTNVVDLDEQNKRLQAQILKLKGEVAKVAKQAEKQRKEKNDLKRQSESSTSKSISLSLSQKPKTLDLSQNSAINPTKLHEHLNLIQGQVASGVTIERDSLTQLFTSRAQAALVQRYEAWKMLHDSDGEKDPDVFNLPTTEFITLMYELFPIAHHTHIRTRGNTIIQC